MQGNVSEKVLAQAALLAGGDMEKAKRWYLSTRLPSSPATRLRLSSHEDAKRTLFFCWYDAGSLG